MSEGPNQIITAASRLIPYELASGERVMMTPEQAEAYSSRIAKLARLSGEKFRAYFPDHGPLSRAHYAKHIEFFDRGAQYKERLFMAANRVGKTETGAFEMTCHLTGRYPDWWKGKRFDHPVEAWACGTTSETLRDIVQSKLFGPWHDEEHRGGMVPSDLIAHTSRRPHGLPGSLETVWVKHVSGGLSMVGLKMYEQGRKSFEGTAKHVIWCDEEPPEDVYTEMLFRTATTKGITMVTFTPLQGMSAVVSGFLMPNSEEAKEFKWFIMAGWDDVPHLDESEKKALIATTPPYQRDARTKGVPSLGSGAIFAIPESEISCSPFPIPRHWRKCFGLDAGGGAKPTAIAWGAIDVELQNVYVYDVYRRESPELAIHVNALEQRGKWIPGAGDAAALILTAHDVEQIVVSYQKAGIDIILADKAVESGLQDVWDLMSAGKFKVFETCSPWFEEYRIYHRDEKGRIVKQKDHLMDATRYMVRTGIKRAITPNHKVEQRDQWDDIFGGNRGGSWMGQ